MAETWLQDLRFALRLLRRSPLFTLTAVLSLAIGIGANTTIFSVVSALLLRPLPGITDASRLVDVGRTQNGRDFDNSSYPNYKDIRDRVTTVSGLYALRLEPQPMSLGGADGADRIYGTLVSANYFTTLGTRPLIGRLLVDADDGGAPGSHPVMVISYELWQRRFGGDPNVLGQVVPLNAHPFTIVGVAPPGFQGTTILRSDAWVPISAEPASPRGSESILTSRQAVWLLMGGRLRPGVTVAQADAELASIGAALEREFPNENRGKGLKVMRSAVVPGHIDIFAGFLGLLMGIVGVVLLIACVNLSGMLLARATTRRREIAVRLAIGASRWRLVRQMLCETALLFVAGSVAGLMLSGWLRTLLMAVLPQLPVPIGLDMPIDVRVLAFAIVLSGAATIVCGLAPALQASKPDLVPSLKADGGGDGTARLRLRSVFLVGQIALSLLLVVTAGLFLRALGRANSLDPGFDQSRVDVVMLDLSLARYTETTGVTFGRDLIARAATQPGVASVALAADLPLDGGRMRFGSLRTPGFPRANGEIGFDADWNVVSPGFFRTLNIRLVRGRDFNDADVATAPGVAIVNETMARRIWGDTDPLGRTIEANDGSDSGWRRLTIVGVAADAQVIALGEKVDPYIYAPVAQRYTPRLSLLMKHAGASSIPQMRAVIRQMNPNLPVTQALPLREVTSINLIPQRIVASVAGTLGIVGLLLAAIGIYGVTSYAASRRVREIGIRVALGADTSSVVRLILRQGIGLTAIGVGIGLVAGVFASQILRALLFGIGTLDPIAFAGAAVLFLVVALASTYGPARRATRVDPMTALRAE